MATTSAPIAPISPQPAEQLIGPIADGAEAEEQACTGARTDPGHDWSKASRPASL